MFDFSDYKDEDIISLVSSDAAAELKKRGYEFGWHKKTTPVGAIYILVNPAFPKLVKIGYADDVQKRMKTLNSSSGLPDPYHCFAIYKVKTRLTDLRLHGLIDTLDPSLRHTQSREFYDMDCDKALKILSAISQINGDEAQLIVNPFSDSYFAQSQSGQSGTGTATSAPSTQKQSNLTFGLLGIPIGSKLVYVKDNSVVCTTLDDVNKVEYRGKTYSISKLASELQNGVAAQGGKYFMYNGEILTEMRKRLGV